MKKLIKSQLIRVTDPHVTLQVTHCHSRILMSLIFLHSPQGEGSCYSLVGLSSHFVVSVYSQPIGGKGKCGGERQRESEERGLLFFSEFVFSKTDTYMRKTSIVHSHTHEKMTKHVCRRSLPIHLFIYLFFSFILRYFPFFNFSSYLTRLNILGVPIEWTYPIALSMQDLTLSVYENRRGSCEIF